MKSILSYCIIATGLCTSAFADSAAPNFFNWSEYSGTTFTSGQNASLNSFYTNGVSVNVAVTGSGFTKGTVERAGHGYNIGGYANPTTGQWVQDQHALALYSNFSAKGESITVTLTFDKAISGLSFDILGLQTGTPSSYWPQLTYGWQNAIKGIQGNYEGQYVEAIISGNSLSFDANATSGIYGGVTADPNSPYGFSGVFYGLDGSNNNYEGTNGNLTVSFDQPVTGLSFTFFAGDHLTPDREGNAIASDPGEQRIVLGKLDFTGTSNRGGAIPEPSTTVALFGLGALGAVLVLRRRKAAKA